MVWKIEPAAACRELQGAFSLLIMTPTCIAGVRDPHGLRPLWIGQTALVQSSTISAGDMDPQPFASVIGNFYMTDPISRASATMAECSAAFAADKIGATGTDG